MGGVGATRMATNSQTRLLMLGGYEKYNVVHYNKGLEMTDKIDLEGALTELFIDYQKNVEPAC